MDRADVPGTADPERQVVHRTGPAPRPPPPSPRSVHFRTEIGRTPARDRFILASRPVRRTGPGAGVRQNDIGSSRSRGLRRDPRDHADPSDTHSPRTLQCHSDGHLPPVRPSPPGARRSASPSPTTLTLSADRCPEEEGRSKALGSEPLLGHHCETTATGTLLSQLGLRLSEPMLFGSAEDTDIVSLAGRLVPRYGHRLRLPRRALPRPLLLALAPRIGMTLGHVRHNVGFPVRCDAGLSAPSWASATSRPRGRWRRWSSRCCPARSPTAQGPSSGSAG